jgi:hypothetical protein
MKYIVAMILLFLTGCATATVQTNADGDCKATYTSFFKGVDSAELEG